MDQVLEVRHPQDPSNRTTLKMFIIKLVVWGLVATLIVSLFLLILWLGLFQNQKKIFSGINFYKHPVIIEIGEEAREVDTFGTYTIILEPPPGEVTITVSAKNGTPLTERTHKLTNNSSVIIDYFSEGNEIKQCFIQADVTRLFYTPAGADAQAEFKLGHYATLTDQAAAGIFHNFSGEWRYMLVPGTYNGDNLPRSIDITNRVTGVYPVDCNNLSDKDKLRDEILWWTNFDPALQKRLFNERLQEVINNPGFRY